MSEVVVPAGCADPVEGQQYWEMLKSPGSVVPATRATLDMHVTRCEACLRKSLDKIRPAVEAEARRAEGDAQT